MRNPPIFTILLFAFIAVPIFEIYLFIEVGGMIGALATVGLVILTAVTGAFLLRAQGFATVARIRETMEKGEIPAIEMLEGAVLLFGGALLLTPGFFTDTIGFLCLLPVVRRKFVLYLLSKRIIVNGADFQSVHIEKTIEGEFRRDDRDL